MRRVMGSALEVLVEAEVLDVVDWLPVLVSEPEPDPLSLLPHAAREETMARASSRDVSFFFILIPPKIFQFIHSAVKAAG